MTESDFERFFLLSSELLCIAGLDGIIRRVNPALSEHLDREAAELPGLSFVDLVHPGDRHHVAGCLGLLSDGDGAVDFRCRHLCRDGSICWLEWQITAGGGAIHAAGRDVTDNVGQAERRQRLEILGQLAGSVAHELRNPLGAIANSVYYLRNANADLEPDSRECLVDIDRAVATSNRIVGELLDYARPPELEKEHVTCCSLFDEAIALLEMPATVTVQRDLEEPCGLRVDRGQMVRVLRNLLLNAVQAMNGQGPIIVTCREIGNEAVFSVRDTGPGIAEEDQEKLFEPLVSSKSQGVGLGLPLSRRYAELNGGRLEVDSRPGEGATFRLALPLEPKA